MVWVWIAVGTLGPVLTVVLLEHLTNMMDGLESLWRRLRRREVVPDGPAIECLAADLHRLSLQLSRVERSNEIAKVFRLRATSLAYDDVLLCACRVLDVDTAAQAPLEPVERLQTEAVLAQRGLVW
ncbi:MAG: hypothetical protein QOI54_2994 [Actinomycetota bacterium]|jgi:hypothetical protein|nr:hypothetical protein [Actinomycetota bacterium]